ncbi:uncharacterized protein LODBEIA_P19420 [Lodderomyces beijingensis]|uniref:Myb-like domain-containing protein n=1 Tax=Lodderomyces beijingensis TaxID=1775926 RepID=A0ABP0ZHV1_9ASCO
MPPFVSPQLTSYEQQPRDSQTNEQLLSQNGDGDWSSVYPPLRKKPKQSTNWTSAEDKLLLELKEVRKLGWREISTFFHDRTPNACQFRWRRMISAVSPVLATANTKVAIARNDNREAELGAEESSSTSLSSSSRNVDPHAESQPPNDDDSESSKSVLDEDEPVYKMRRNVHSIEYLLN